ncbi:hypothetical protein [Corynebacterium frankenforstense]
MPLFYPASALERVPRDTRDDAALAPAVDRVVRELCALEPFLPGQVRVLVVLGDNALAAAVRGGARRLVEAGVPVDVCGAVAGECHGFPPVTAASWTEAGARVLDSEPVAVGYRLIVENLGPGPLSPVQADLFDDARSQRARVLSVGTPAGVDPHDASAPEPVMVHKRGFGDPDEPMAHGVLDRHVTATVTLAAGFRTDAHALSPYCGQVVATADSGLPPGWGPGETVFHCRRVAAGDAPLERPLDLPPVPQTLERRAVVAVADTGAPGRLRARAALSAGAARVSCPEDVEGTEPPGPASQAAPVTVRGDEIRTAHGRILLEHAEPSVRTFRDALERADAEDAAVVVPGRRAIVALPLGRGSVIDAGVPWGELPGGRDVLAGLIAARVAAHDPGYDDYLDAYPRLRDRLERAGELRGPYARPVLEAVALYQLAAGLAADGLPTTAGAVVDHVRAAWRVAQVGAEDGRERY